jgi:hypothetical protein
MSATKAVDYGVGKMLTNRLFHIHSSSVFVIKDSFDFVRKIHESSQVDRTMASFDVTGLFSNVSLAFIIGYIVDRIYPVCPISCAT